MGNIYAGKRILYKQGSGNWQVGIIQKTEKAEVNEQGVWIPIQPLDSNEEIHWAEIHNLFTDCYELQEWVKDYSEYYMTKEDYCKFIKNENFNKATETAYFADDEYYYYPVSKYSTNWIMKQPFDYIVRNE